MGKKEPFGWHLMLDLSGCDLVVMTDYKAIEHFAGEFCRVIEMKAFGKPFIEKFGASGSVAEGYSLVQLIETSAMVAHFSDKTGAIYFDIFSCKEFDPKEAKKFTVGYFKARKSKSRFIPRGE